MMASNEWDLDDDPKAPVLELEPGPAPKAKKAGARKEAENLYAEQLVQYRLPPSVRELRFAKDDEDIKRLWQFDFAFPEYKLAIEIQGLAVVWIQIGKGKRRPVCLGRHTTPDGFHEDCKKKANAAVLGWTVIPFTTNQVRSKLAVTMTQRILMARGWKGPI